MKSYTPDKIFNVALLGHSSSGKTTFAEAAAFLCGDVERMGKAADGSLLMYADAEEKKRGVSLSASVLALERGGYKLNLIDAPGLFDFAAGVREAVRAADAGLIILSGKSGLNVGSEQAYDLCVAQGKPRAFFVGKMDSSHAAYNKVLNQLTSMYGTAVCPVTAPFYEGETLGGYVDLVAGKAYSYASGVAKEVSMPGDPNIPKLTDLMIEAAASQDDALMEKYFDGQTLSEQEIVAALKKGVCTGEIVPIFTGAQQEAAGIDLTLDLLTRLFPEAASVKDGDVACDPNGPTAAIVFKTVADPFVGRISLFKVVSGKISPASRLINARTGEEQRVGKPLMLKGSRQIEADAIGAGDIGALTKLSDVMTGDTLCDPAKKVTLAGVEYPAPTISMAVYAIKKGEEEKIASGLNRLMEEDPTITFATDSETGEQILSGLGESHLDVIASKLKSKFATDMKMEVPKVAYREAIRKKVKVQGRHKKQSGGHGQFGDVWIEFEPCDSTEMVFEEKVFGGSVPKNFFPAVEKGLRESCQHGVLAGYPVVGLKAILVDGSYHPVDSSEMAFKTAASLAYKAGLVQASPVLLEPVGTLTVKVPDDFMGAVSGDINKRRGRVLGMNPLGHKISEIVAEVPIGEMHDFSTAMRSLTQGRASFTLEFARYEDMPEAMAKKVIEAAKVEE
ncbi:MAG: elongation factor G [Clostridia bacterium]|nr:elongation factor G [Clostridia bacterium]